METLYSRCCGLDVHKSSITACVLLEQSQNRGKHIRRFGCTTRELQELVTWLRDFGVEHVSQADNRFAFERVGLAHLLACSLRRLRTYTAMCAFGIDKLS
jgi:hypothetical protein